MAHRFKEYQPHKGEIERRTNGSMIAMESGTAFAYAIDKLQDLSLIHIFTFPENIGNNKVDKDRISVKKS